MPPIELRRSLPLASLSRRGFLVTLAGSLAIPSEGSQPPPRPRDTSERAISKPMTLPRRLASHLNGPIAA